MLSFASTSLFPFPARNKTVAGRHRKSNAAGKRSHIRRLLGEQLEARRVLASYTVDTANDIVAEDGMLSLREAIQAANMNAVINADTVAGGAGPGTIDTITFAAGLSTLTLGSELSITDSLRISLGDASEITIRGNNAARIFSIDANPDATIANTVSIEGLMLKDGVAAVGGAIYVATGQSLSLDSVTLSGNTATGDAATQGGGAIYNDGGTLSLVDSTLSGNAASGTAGSGGAIFNATGGTLQIATSMITGNTANRAGGGIETTAGSNASLTNVNVNGNSLVNATASPGNGGGVHVGGNAVVAIVGGTVNDNQAVEGGGVWTSASGSLTIDGTMIDGNTAAAGGGIYNDVAAVSTNEVFGLTFTELNGSGVTGTGSVTVTSPTATTRTVRVVIDAEGLEDVSAFGGIHAAHIHGQFAGNAARPILEQGDGPFFDGAGGLANGFAPIDSVLPSIADDGVTIEDGFLDFLEGQPKYGPVLLNLTSTQLRDASAFSSNPPAGVPPLAHFLALADNGAIDPSALFPSGTEFNLDTTYTFDLTNPDEARQFNNLAPLDFREVVLHGQTIDKSISDAIDAAAMGTAPGGIDLGNGTAFRVTAPVAAAEIVPMGSSVPTTNAAINNATIRNATIRNNAATGNAAVEGGGGIHNENGSLTITNSTITGNVATGAAGSGGGIINVGGTVSVTNSEISGNTANRAGGGIETTSGSTVTLNGVTLDTNSAGVDIGAGATPAPGNGGGLHVSGDGTVNVTGGTVSGNRAALEGGGLWNDSGTMTIDGTTISGNTASGDAADDGGGGIFNNGGTLIINGGAVSMNVADGSSGSGGGILNLGGSTTVTNSEISGNTANRAGGGIETTSGSTVTLDGVTLDTNSAGVDIGVGATPAPGNGGGLHVSGDGTVTVTGGTVSGNVAAQEGGGLWNDSGLMTISGTSLLGNTANAGNNTNNDQGGGGIFNNGGTLAISGATIRGNISVVNAGNGGGVMTVGGTVTINNTALSENVAARAGGAIENNAGEVTLTNVILGGELNAGNTAGINGGAVHLSGQAMLSVLESTVASNTAANEGGGLWNSAAGTIHVVRSTLSGNTAQDGGGIFNDGTTGDITIANSTIAANSATNLGGGIASEGGKLTLTSVTLAGNTAAAGGGIATQGGDFTATNTLVANNNAATGADALGTINSGGNNLFGDSSGVTLLGTSSSDIIDVDAGLGMLDDNGGTTQTIALLDASPALNAGVAAGLSIDQRGVARPQGLAIDIGAFESSLGGAVGKALLSIAATDAIKKEGDSGLTPFTFTVTRSGNTDVEATVDYAVTGTGLHQATADDFKNGVFPSGTIEFAQGELSQTLTIYVRGDTAVEIYDRFRVTLDNPSATAETIDATANGTILDDDLVIPSLNIIIPHQVEGGQTIPGDGSTNAILFQSLTDTVVSVTPVGTAVINERILIFDTHIQLISTMHGTIATADLEAGGVYAIVFEPQSFDRIFAIRTSTGSGTLSQAAPTNILQPTDTNGSGETTALDAVIVINAIDRNHGTQGEQVIPRFLDVNRDNKVSALDALQIINHLNRIGSGLVQTDAHGESIPMLITNDSTLQTQSASQRDDAVDALFRNSSSESTGSSFVDPSSPTIDPPSIHSTANLDAVDEAMEEDEFGSNSVLQDPIELLV
ncbi:beta strand repeat-containing protein [Novipirellula galeiformis]|nr:choice-of-anchor Q domain-containing protein [Novipirellula galeiformis]